MSAIPYVPTIPQSEQRTIVINLPLLTRHAFKLADPPRAIPTEDFKSRVDDETTNIHRLLISKFPRPYQLSYLAQSVKATSPPSERTTDLRARFGT